MTPTRIVLLAMLVLAGPASADGAAFGPTQALDLRVSGPLAAAVGPRGEAVVAGVNAAAPVGQRVEVATRAGSRAPWKVASLGRSAARARDVQVVAARGRAVVAWGEVRRHGQAVVVATGRVGDALTVRRRLAVADAFAASRVWRSCAAAQSSSRGATGGSARAPACASQRSTATASRPRREPSAATRRRSC
jgi:hypothetical protein